jgi:hypothetical protein
MVTHGQRTASRSPWPQHRDGLQWTDLFQFFGHCGYSKPDIQVAVFWVVTSRSDVVGYQRFGGPCCHPLQGDVTSFHPEDVRRKLGSWVRIPLEALKYVRAFFCCAPFCWQRPCDGPIPHPRSPTECLREFIDAEVNSDSEKTKTT